jgi:hypothetical protein
VDGACRSSAGIGATLTRINPIQALRSALRAHTPSGATATWRSSIARGAFGIGINPRVAARPPRRNDPSGQQACSPGGRYERLDWSTTGPTKLPRSRAFVQSVRTSPTGVALRRGGIDRLLARFWESFERALIARGGYALQCRPKALKRGTTPRKLEDVGARRGDVLNQQEA